jgi:hypothetical protein
VVKRSIGWPAGFWFVGCAGLAAIVVYQLFHSFPLAPTVTAAPPAAPILERVATPPEPRVPRDDAVDDIAARPLFSAERRPYVAPPPPRARQAALAPDQPALPLELAGTYLSGANRAALVQISGRAPEWLRPGDLIDGWRIDEIKQDQVQLRKGDQGQVLLLRADLAVEPRRRPVPARPAQQADDEPESADEAPGDKDETQD